MGWTGRASYKSTSDRTALVGGAPRGEYSHRTNPKIKSFAPRAGLPQKPSARTDPVGGAPRGE